MNAAAIVPAMLAGRCTTGEERGHGTLVHAVYLVGRYPGGPALCGAKPGRRSAGWSDSLMTGAPITCSRCAAKMGKVRQEEFFAGIRQSGMLARAAGIHRTGCALAAGSEAARAWLDGWDERENTLALLEHLRARYPRHDFGTADKESLSVEEEEAPALLIVWTHQGMCCFDPLATDSGFGRCDPLKTYGITARDAERIRTHNVAGLV